MERLPPLPAQGVITSAIVVGVVPWPSVALDNKALSWEGEVGAVGADPILGDRVRPRSRMAL